MMSSPIVPQDYAIAKGVSEGRLSDHHLQIAQSPLLMRSVSFRPLLIGCDDIVSLVLKPASTSRPSLEQASDVRRHVNQRPSEDVRDHQIRIISAINGVSGAISDDQRALTGFPAQRRR